MYEAWPGPGAAGEACVPLGTVGEGRERLVPARHPERSVVRAVDRKPGWAVRQPTLKQKIQEEIKINLSCDNCEKEGPLLPIEIEIN